MKLNGLALRIVGGTSVIVAALGLFYTVPPLQTFLKIHEPDPDAPYFFLAFTVMAGNLHRVLRSLGDYWNLLPARQDAARGPVCRGTDIRGRLFLRSGWFVDDAQDRWKRGSSNWCCKWRSCDTSYDTLSTLGTICRILGTARTRIGVDASPNSGGRSSPIKEPIVAQRSATPAEASASRCWIGRDGAW